MINGFKSFGTVYFKVDWLYSVCTVIIILLKTIYSEQV